MSPVHTRQNPCPQNHKDSGQPGRSQIKQVVQPGCTAAEVHVSVIFVSHHGIHGVDGLVQRASCRPQKCHEQKGGNDTVRGIFSHGLHGCPGDSALIQRCGIPSHNHGYIISGLLGAAFLQAAAHLHALCIQSPGCQHETAQKSLCRQKQCPSPVQAQLLRPVNGCPRNTPPYDAHGDGEDGPCPELAFLSHAPAPLSEPRFHSGNHGSHKAHRMGEP